MSLGIFSDQGSPPLPSWTSRLPRPLRSRVENVLTFGRSLSVRRRWNAQVEAPEFLRIRRQEWTHHSHHGPFASLWLTAEAVRPGIHRGSVRVTLSAAGRTPRTVDVPVAMTVVDRPPTGAVLLVSTPFDRYSTENGGDFEPLTALTSRLAERGVQTDFLENLPSPLDRWQVVLLGTDALVRLDPRRVAQVQAFVRQGGRLILSADAFYDTTARQANRVLEPFGLMLGSRDVALRVTADRVAADPLTAGVSSLEFWRPTGITVTDPRQGRLLATTSDSPGHGFLAVSREAGRGDLVVLAQSLWSFWILPASGTNQAWVLQHLLTPPHSSTPGESDGNPSPGGQAGGP